MCSENFPGGLIFSREGSKLSLNQVPDQWVSYFHRNESFQNPRIGLESTSYLVNIENINFSDMTKLCGDLNIEYDKRQPQSTMNNVVRSLSNKYTDSTVILLCDEVQCYESPDWSNMETCHNVIWLLAINPRSNSYDGNMNIVYPTSDDVLCQQLQVKYRNCHQIR